MMHLELDKQVEAPLLSRKRVTFMADYEGKTPSRMDFVREISKNLKANEKCVVIRHIYQRFGSRKAKIIVHVYKNEEDKKAIEEPALLKKHEPKKRAQEEGASGEQVSPQAGEPKEEKKE